MPSPTFNKLRARLAELFQLDAAAELDFGIGAKPSLASSCPAMSRRDLAKLP